MLVVYIYKNTKNANTWVNHCDAHLLEHVLVGQATRTNKTLYPAYFGIIWCVAIFALAGPTWQFKDVPIYQKRNSTVIALDVSQSMDTTDVSPTRLERAKYKIIDVLRRIDEGQTGLVVFSSEAFVVSPLTSDTNTIESLVSVINSDIVPVKGHSILNAIKESSSLLINAGVDKGTIVIITDSTPTAAAIEEAKKIYEKGITIDVYAIGTSSGGMARDENGKFAKDTQGNIQYFGVNLRALQSLAEAGGGEIVTLTSDNSDIKHFIKYADEASKIKKEESLYANAFWQDEGIYFIWILGIFSVLVFRRGFLEKICR
jgi:Ca-activated chloride channel family protein